jgi:hypothetical protein
MKVHMTDGVDRVQLVVLNQAIQYRAPRQSRRIGPDNAERRWVGVDGELIRNRGLREHGQKRENPDTVFFKDFNLHEDCFGMKRSSLYVTIGLT